MVRTIISVIICKENISKPLADNACGGQATSQPRSVALRNMSSHRVCVVGAGAAGLCSARHLAAAGRSFQVVEQAARLGGTWLYSDAVGGHSSMYYNLRTNFPKEIMSYIDRPFKEGDVSFLHHSDVLDYLESFAREFDLYKHIKFSTRVENVKPVRHEDGALTWTVTTKDLTDDTLQEQEFDAVMVCNGHYSKSLMPHIPRLDDFKGIKIHSHNYRRPEMFAGLTVMIVGASFSGVDIAMDVHAHASQVLISHGDPPPLACNLPEKVKRVPKVRSACEDSFILEDGSVWKADAVIFCTGYEYEFPFLDSSCNVTVEDGRVTPLYKHFIHIRMPSLAFIGLPSRSLPFSMFDLQVQFFLKMLDKKISLPNPEEMEKDADEDLQRRGPIRMSPRHAHQLGEWQWEYLDYLSEVSRCMVLKPVYRKLFDHTVETMEENFINYKNFNYKMVDQENYICTN